MLLQQQRVQKKIMDKDGMLKHNKEMIEELNVNKLLMNINKEELPEMKIDKQFPI